MYDRTFPGFEMKAILVLSMIIFVPVKLLASGTNEEAMQELDSIFRNSTPPPPSPVERPVMTPPGEQQAVRTTTRTVREKPFSDNERLIAIASKKYGQKGS